jgi:hypothetical protein
MFNNLREIGLALIAASPHCTLSTTGEANLEASMVTCVIAGGRIYALVPATADHLLNLEHETEAILTTFSWQVRGTARIIPAARSQDGTMPADIVRDASARGLAVVEVLPLRMHMTDSGSWHTLQTIDFDPPGSAEDRR